jgi:methionyl-tRNA formyltransferase
MESNLKIIFAGTPDFAASALAEIIAHGYDVVAVLTQPDRPAGRGMQLSASSVKQLALQHGLPVLQPLSLKTIEIQQQLAELGADLMIVAAYGLILPKAVLALPRLGCLNIHASLLPRWRGAAPIQRAILAGDTETGITIMQMDEGLDTGAMLLKKVCPIAAKETAASLHDRLAELGALAILEALQGMVHSQLVAEVQNNDLATYASKLTKSEARIDWTRSAVEIERSVRGYHPFPGVFSEINSTAIKIWQATVVNEVRGEPGVILQADKERLLVACGSGGLSLEILQRPGGKALPNVQFLQGFQVKVGEQFKQVTA